MKTDQCSKPVTVFPQNLTTAVSRLKNRLQREYEQAYPGLRDLIRIVLDEEEAHAWNLSFPHLFLPDLMEAHFAQLGLQPTKYDNLFTPVTAAAEKNRQLTPAYVHR